MVKEDKVKDTVTDPFEQAGQFVQSLVSQYEPDRKQRQGQINTARTAWQIKQRRTKTKGLANLGTPETHIAVETWIPRIYGAIFPFRNFYSYDCPIADKNSARLVPLKDYMRQLCDQMKYEKYCEKAIRTDVLEGYVFCKIPFSMATEEGIETVEEEVPVFEKVPLLGYMPGSAGKFFQQQVGTKKVLKRIPYKRKAERPELCPCDNLKMLFDNTVEEFENLPCVIEEVELRWSYLKSLEKTTKKNSKGEDETKGVYSNLDDLYEEVIKGMKETDKHLDPMIKCYEYWGRYDIDGKGEPAMCVIVKPKDCTKAIRLAKNNRDNKKIPYVFSKFLPVSGQLIGMGIPELIERMQKELDETRNLIMDNKNLNLYHQWLLSPSSGLTKKDIEKPYPGRVIIPKSGGVGQDVMRELVVNDFTGSGLNSELVIKDDIRRATKAIMPFQGTESKTNTTAYEIGSLVKEANVAIKLIIERFTTDIIEASLDIFKDLIDQHLDHDVVCGSQTYTPDMLKIPGKFKAIGVANMEQDLIEAKKAIDIFNAFKGVQYVIDEKGQTIPIVTKKVFERLLNAQKEEDIAGYFGEPAKANANMMPGNLGTMGAGGGGGEQGGMGGVNPLMAIMQSLTKGNKVG